MSKGRRFYINVWDSCNLNCKHCFNEGGKVWGDLLSFSEIMRLIEEAQKDMGIEEVQMSGGEPTQRPDIFPIIKGLQQKGIKILLQTNGVFDSQIIDEIFKLSEEGLSLIVSLDGIETNDYFRGPGASEKTINNLKMLSKEFSIRINTLLSAKIKWEEVEKLVWLAGDLNISIAFNPICPSGRADRSWLMPSDKYFEWMYKLENPGYGKIKVRKCFKTIAGQIVESEECPVRKGSAIHIAADGEAYPCGFLNYQELSIGSVRKASLVSLLKKMPPRCKSLAEECTHCEFYTKGFCHAGCPARIYALYKRFDQVDIYCMAKYIREMRQ